VAGRDGFGPDLVHVVTARRPAPDDLPGTLDRVRVVDAFAALADPEHGGSTLVEDAEAVTLEDAVGAAPRLAVFGRSPTL
jgi:hypothetical protein